MTRNQEWQEFVEATKARKAPVGREAELCELVRRDQERHNWRKAGGISLSCLALLFIVFVVLVNTSVVFARAVGEISALSRLAKAVAYSPSMKAAIENKYVQPIGLTQVEDGVEFTIHYVIADEKHLTYFYTHKYLPNPQVDYIAGQIDLQGAGGTTAPLLYSSGGAGYQNNLWVGEFYAEDGESLPLHFTLSCSVAPALHSNQGQYPAPTFHFEIELDPLLTHTGYTQTIDQWVTIAGQRVYFDKLETYPTRSILWVDVDSTNTARLKKLQLTLDNERGEVFDAVKNGISGYFSENGDLIKITMESSYFSSSARLETLTINGAAFLPDDERFIKVDLQKHSVTGLPERVRMLSMQQTEDMLTFNLEMTTPNPSQDDSVQFGIPTGIDGAEVPFQEYTQSMFLSREQFDAILRDQENMENPEAPPQALSPYTESESNNYYFISYKGLDYSKAPYTIEIYSAPLLEIEPIVLRLPR